MVDFVHDSSLGIFNIGRFAVEESGSFMRPD